MEGGYEIAYQYMLLQVVRRLALDDYEKAFLEAAVVDMNRAGRGQL